MLDSLRRAIYHTLKAAWYGVFGEPLAHVHRFEPYWTAPHTLIQRCACGELGPHECLSLSGVCIWCDPRVKVLLGESPLPKPVVRVSGVLTPKEVKAIRQAFEEELAVDS